MHQSQSIGLILDRILSSGIAYEHGKYNNLKPNDNAERKEIAKRWSNLQIARKRIREQYALVK